MSRLYARVDRYEGLDVLREVHAVGRVSPEVLSSFVLQRGAGPVVAHPAPALRGPGVTGVIPTGPRDPEATTSAAVLVTVLALSLPEAASVAEGTRSVLVVDPKTKGDPVVVAGKQTITLTEAVTALVAKGGKWVEETTGAAP